MFRLGVIRLLAAVADGHFLASPLVNDPEGPNTQIVGFEVPKSIL